MDEEIKAGIQRSSSRKPRTRKKKKSQIPIGIIAVLAAVIFGILLGTKNQNMPIYWIVGIAFGYILQRSRFCFTAAMRDPYLTGSTSLTRAVLVAFAITTIGFAAIKYGAFKNGLPIPGQS